MKLIIKGEEPAEWTAYRNTNGARYKSIPELRKALYNEQGGICAYCMQGLIDEYKVPTNAEYIGDPLKPERVTNRIEHIKCREREEYEKYELDYSNMVMCCCGKSYSADYKLAEHCDVAKGSKDILFTPFDEDFINSVSYDEEGIISSSNETCKVQLEVVLNLNENMLVEYRRRAYKVIGETIRSRKWKVSEMRLFLKNLEERDRETGRFKPFCGVSIYYVKKLMTAKGIDI